MSAGAPVIEVEVVHAGTRGVVTKIFRLEVPATVADALQMASADPDFAGADMGTAAVGVFGIVARPEQALEEGDRVEIYRPLAADPKSARRARAKEARRKR